MSGRRSTRGIEENIMAILDSSGLKEARDVHDDRLTFLEAVRAASLVPESGTSPTSNMMEAIFDILKDSTSLELIVISYLLLLELDKRFPRVYISHPDTSKSSSIELMVVQEAWSPFVFGVESAYSDREANSGNPLDTSGFSLLTQNISKEFDEINCQESEMKLFGNMLLFQYLVNVLEQDFLPRKTVYKETMNWTLVRESLLNMLLGSRRISYKGLMKDCLSIITKGSHHHAPSSINDKENADKFFAEISDNHDAALAASLIEMQKGTCMSVQKLMILIMELDMAKKGANMQCCTSRADGVRTPLVEIILDELTYDEELVSPFLKVFCEPNLKLDIVLQYFWKYLTKPSVRTRRSSTGSEDTTFEGVLKCFSSDASTRSITKKISSEVIQLLLAHAFQAYMSLQCHSEHTADSSDVIRGNSHLQICNDLISAFHSLRRTDKDMDITPLGKEALFTAATMLSTQS